MDGIFSQKCRWTTAKQHFELEANYSWNKTLTLDHNTIFQAIVDELFNERHHADDLD